MIGVPREIRVYLGRDPASKELFNQLVAIVRSLPKDRRPRLKVKTLKISDPSEFESFLSQLEELFGGIYTMEFRKYDIKAIPAIIVDGQKVIEGKYPTPEEIRSIVLGEQYIPPAGLQPQEELSKPLPPAIKIEPAQQLTGEHPPSTEQPNMQPSLQEEKSRYETPQQPLQPTPISGEEVGLPSGAKTTSEETTVEELKPIEIQPVELPEIEEPSSSIEPKHQAPELPSPPVRPPHYARETREPSLQKTELKPLSVERKLEEKPSERPVIKPEKKEVKNTCLDCVFYNQTTGRCALLHIVVQDPYNPPCGRGRRK